MIGLIIVVVMSLLLGAASFGIGMIPLFFRLTSELSELIVLLQNYLRDSGRGEGRICFYSRKWVDFGRCVGHYNSRVSAHFDLMEFR